MAKKRREVRASKTGREDRADWEGGQQDPKEPEANLLLIKSLCNNPFLRPWIGIRIETYPILVEKEKDSQSSSSHAPALLFDPAGGSMRRVFSVLDCTAEGSVLHVECRHKRPYTIWLSPSWGGSV